MSNRMGKEKRGPLALELWAKQLIDGYPGVSVRNMTTSWRNGLAFCALIHRFRPDLIDYDKLDASDIIGNCSLAFDVAESKLGIPSLLDPIDMAAMDIPDRLSVLTYVAQFYNAFKNSEAKSRIPPRQNDEVDENNVLKKRSGDKSGSTTPDKIVSKRKNEGVDEDEIMDKVRRSMPKKSVLLSSSSVCSECKNPVFISERVLFMKKLYHRSCFRCSNCKNPLNPHIVDISSDGSLFCLEKTCHAELLRKTNGSPIDKNVDNMLKDNDLVKVDEAICQNRPDLSSSSLCENSEPTNLNVEGASLLVNANEPRVDSVQDDSKSQGDMQTDKEEAVVPVNSVSTPRSTKKLLDFAGALLHTEPEKENSKSVESLSPSQISNTDVLPELKGKLLQDPTAFEKNEAKITSEVENDKLAQTNLSHDVEAENFPDSPSSKPLQMQQDAAIEEVINDIELKRAEEITSIRDKAILTVADQFKVFIEKPSEDEPQETSEKEQAENESSDSHEDIAETKVQERELFSESILEPAPEKRNSLKICNSNSLEQGDASELVTISAAVTPPSTTPSPIPKRRPPKPPPPKMLPSTSPSARSQNSPKTEELKPTSELWRNKDYYPADLNPFESEEDLCEVKPNKLDPKNPFDDEEEENEELPPPMPSPIPKPRNLTSTPNSNEINNNANVLLLNIPSCPPKNAANFNLPPPRPPPPHLSPRKLPVIKPYNPFEDDDDDIGEYEDDKVSGSFPKSPADDSGSISSKTSDLSSISGVPTPTPRSLNASDTEGSGSLKIRSRKSRRAPLPPTLQSPQEGKDTSEVKSPESLSTTNVKKLIPVSPKLMKALNFPSPSSPSSSGVLTHRKKRRAPPPRRRVEPLPEAAIRTEFEDLEIKLKELERQGIAYETKIRAIMEAAEENPTGDCDDQPPLENNEENDFVNNSEQVDELMVQLWSIVNEKNDILRRQTELDYLRRGHRLEEMQAELDFRLRVLMETPEDQKQPNHADMEEELLQQLMKLVDDRNEVVEWLDYHRQLDREEELLVTKSITEFSSNKPVEPIPEPNTSTKSKAKDKKPKEAKEKKPKEEKEKKQGKLKLGLFKKSKKSKTLESKPES